MRDIIIRSLQFGAGFGTAYTVVSFLPTLIILSLVWIVSTSLSFLFAAVAQCIWWLLKTAYGEIKRRVTLRRAPEEA